uniref:BPTI/Kunitz inhibitor domain-containing protein n=1 Tax=Panagrolaimus sp. ES5 TaxID=591445 RepID=A0AC34G611_9BILA
MYLGCGGNGNRFPSRIGCMQICQPGSVKIGQGILPGSGNIGQGTYPGGNNNNPGIGQGAQPGFNSVGQRPINGIGHGINLVSRNDNNNNIGNGAQPLSSMPSIGQGTKNNTGSSIGDGTAPNNNGIGHGTNGLTNLHIQQQNKSVDIFNPFHPGPVKIGNGSWPAPAAPPSQLSTKDFINGYAQMCDTSFGVNIKMPISCGASDSCPFGYQCAGRFCCPTKENVCSQKSESGKELKEQEHVGRYAYEPQLQNCLRFSYFGAEGNFNNFKTYNDCMRFCVGS